MGAGRERCILRVGKIQKEPGRVIALDRLTWPVGVFGKVRFHDHAKDDRNEVANDENHCSQNQNLDKSGGAIMLTLARIQFNSRQRPPKEGRCLVEGSLKRPRCCLRVPPVPARR